MRRTAELIFALALAIIFIPPPGAAQTANVTGTITDQTGAVIPAASIVVTHAETGLKRQSESNALGIYTVPSLPPGNYRIVALCPHAPVPPHTRAQPEYPAPGWRDSFARGLHEALRRPDYPESPKP